MSDFLAQNAGTLLVGGILAIVIGGVIAVMILNKKRGKTSCSCGCANCPYSGKCGSGSLDNT